MTEATGSLTPDDPGEEFIPAETREIADPGAARDITATAHRRREQRRAAVPDEPGSLVSAEERTAPSDRDGGYGSEHGLAADDPAYERVEDLPAVPPSEGAGRGTQLGGDERRDPGEEHF